MDDAKMKEKVEEVKNKAKGFFKNVSSAFGSTTKTGGTSSSCSQAFKGQGHRLGGSAEQPSYGAPAAAPSGGGGGGGCRKLGSGYQQQQQQQNELRRLQQERWARANGTTPAQTPYQQQPAYQQQPVYQQQPAYQQQPVYQQQSAYQQPPPYQQAPYQQPQFQQPAYQQAPPYQQPPIRTQAERVIQAGGSVASAAASVRSPTPEGISVERELRGTVQVGNLPPPRSCPSAKFGSGQEFDPYSPIIASGTSHRPSVSGSIGNNNRVAEPQAKGKFQCPICQTWWQSEAQVSAHIDDCTGGVHSDLARLSIRQEGNAARPREQEGEHVIEDLDDAVAIFLSGGPSTDTIQVLLRVFRNILEFPNEEKYRTLRLSKQKVKETIGSAIGGLKFCESVGFRLVVDGPEKNLIMERPNTEKQERIQAAIAYLDSYESATTTSQAVDPSLMPSAPPARIPEMFDRKLRVFYASQDRAGDKFEVPDSFYNLSAAELKNEAAARRKKLEDSQMLIPKSWKEKQAALAKKKYKCTVVRVQLPDSLIIQGFFKPGEPTSALYEFVASCLKDSTETFELVSPAGAKVRVIPQYPDANGRCPTMEEADLVPKALLKFHPTGPLGYSCLETRCYEMCEPL
ncbi:unnamed protein product [Calypogeia fissa]